MNNNRTTCDPERIELFLQQKLSDEEQTAFELHLDDCDDCRRRLEATAAGDDIWSGVRDSLRGEPLPSNGQRGDSALDSATGDEASSSQATVLKLLAPTDDDRMIGRWGTYEVVGVVGTGGMGVVLKAFEAALNRYVAIKVLAPHLGSSGAARKRFSREAQAAAAVVHENVIEIHGVAEAAGLPYLVMPYVRGPSLQRRLDEQGPLALVEILRVGTQAASGLAAAHAQGLVHRDVKPANILLADGVERVKLTDFGLARAADDASLTKTGIIAGTPQYMSPEQARGEAVDQRSDLFSLGSVLYAMCTGRAPFRAETSYGVLRRITDDEPRPIREINPEIPEWLCQVVAKLMSKHPGDRFQSAREVAGLLEECLAHVQQPTVVPLPAALPKAAARRTWWPPVIRFRGVVAMITALGAGLLGVLLSTAPPDISGQWTGEDWGQVALTSTAAGEYSGTFSDTATKEPGKIALRWSRFERRFNGAWSEGKQRFGELSVRLVDRDIRGAMTTDAKSKVNPGTPRLADLVWTRIEIAAASQSATIARLPCGASVELLGVSENPSKGKSWWKPGGSRLPVAPYEYLNASVTADDRNIAREIAVRLGNLPTSDTAERWEFVPGASFAGGGPPVVAGRSEPALRAVAVRFPVETKVCTVRFGLAVGNWTTVAQSNAQSSSSGAGKELSYSFAPATEDTTGVSLSVAHNATGQDSRVVAIDTQDKTIQGASSIHGGTSAFQQTTISFPKLHLSQIKRFELQTRPYHWVEFRNVSLQPGAVTKRAAAAVFGLQAEQTLAATDGNSDGVVAFRFKNKDVVKPPVAITGHFKDPAKCGFTPELRRWMQDENVDLLLYLDEKSYYVLSFNMRTGWAGQPKEWDTILPDCAVPLLTKMEKLNSEPTGPSIMGGCGYRDGLGEVRVFRTREGLVGFFQLRGLSDADGRGVNIRYKLVQDVPASAGVAVGNVAPFVNAVGTVGKTEDAASQQTAGKKARRTIVSFSIPACYTQTVVKNLDAKRTMNVDVLDADLKTLLAHGTLVAVDNQIDEATGTLPCKAAVSPTKDTLLYPNQFVNVRLFLEAQPGAATESATQETPPAFGPVIERELPGSLTCEQCFLQFRSGKFLAIGHGPATSDKEFDADRTHADDSGGGDIKAVGDGGDGFWLNGEGCFLAAAARTWENLTAADAVKALRHMEGALFSLHPKKKDLPLTYLFANTRGDMGVLQLLDLVGDSKSGDYRVKIRYKLVKGGATRAAAVVTPTDATPGLRRFPKVAVFINFTGSGPNDGLVGDAGPTGKATCVHPGAVSEVSWSWLRTTEQGDVYRFTRIFPFETPAARTFVKEVTYSGGELVVWEDEAQRIGLRSLSRLQFRLVADANDTAPVDTLEEPGSKATCRIRKEVLLDESAVGNASLTISPDNKASVTVDFKEAGSKRFAEITGSNIGKRLGVVFDGKLLTTPTIRSVIRDKALITGNITVTEARVIVQALNSRDNAQTRCAPDSPRQVVAEFLLRLKAEKEKKIDTQKVWDLTTRSGSVGWGLDLLKLAGEERIHPLHQLGNDSQALVLSAPFHDDTGQECVFSAILLRRDGRWLIDRHDAYRSKKEIESLLDGFLLNAGVKFDVEAAELVGRWRYPCASTFTLYADGTGVRIEEGPSGVPEQPERFRWDVSGNVFRMHWPDRTDAAKITRVTDDGFIIIDAKGQAEGFDYREEVIAPGSPHDLVVYDPRLTKKQTHCFGIDVERERMMKEDLTAKLDVADPHRTDVSLIAWTREHRIDAVGRVVRGDGKLAQLGLRTFEMLTIADGSDAWDKATPAQIAEKIRERLADWSFNGQVNDVLTDGKTPATFYFQTRDGSQGLLQILGTTENNGVKIRYKLMQGGASKVAPVPEHLVPQSAVQSARENLAAIRARDQAGTAERLALVEAEQQLRWAEAMYAGDRLAAAKAKRDGAKERLDLLKAKYAAGVAGQEAVTAVERELAEATSQIPADSADTEKYTTAPWGEWNGGWSARLRAEKPVWKAGNLPTFCVDLRKQTGTEPNTLYRSLEGCVVDVDGRQYRLSIVSTAVERKVVFQPGATRIDFLTLQFHREEHDVEVRLLDGGVWINSYQLEPVNHDPKDRVPEWRPGKHVVRVSVPVEQEAQRGRSQQARALSNPVEIVISSPPSTGGGP